MRSFYCPNLSQINHLQFLIFFVPLVFAIFRPFFIGTFIQKVYLELILHKNKFDFVSITYAKAKALLTIMKKVTAMFTGL